MCVCMYVCVCTNIYQYRLLSPFVLVACVLFQDWPLAFDNQ